MTSVSGRSKLSSLILTVVLAGAVGFGTWFAPSEVQARDSDGSRLGASEQKLGTTRDDTLNPPDDRADWRYIQIKEAKTVRFSLDVKPTDKSADLTVTRATGDELETSSTEEGSAEIERKLDPGIYYVEVTSSSKVSYSLRIE